MVVFFLIFFAPALQPPNLEEIQKNVLESRLAIQNGEIEILEKKKSRIDAKTSFEETSFTWKITRSGEKPRGEFLVHKGVRPGIRKIAVANGDVHGWAFFHEALPNVAASFGPVDQGTTLVGKNGPLWFVADFRSFGTMPYEICQSVTEDLGWLLTQCNLKRFPYTIKEDNSGSEKVYRFSGSSQPATVAFSLEFSILPQQGWTFGNIRAWGKNFEIRLETQNQKVDGIWFPKTIKFQKLEHGNLMTEEEVTIQVKSLNKPIPDETFLIKSLKLKDSTFVSLPAGEFKVWTMGKFITYEEYRATAKVPKGIP